MRQERPPPCGLFTWSSESADFIRIIGTFPTHTSDFFFDILAKRLISFIRRFSFLRFPLKFCTMRPQNFNFADLLLSQKGI